jgi:hypothetical protein
LKNKNGFSTKTLAVCAMLSALGVVLLYLGAFIEVLNLSAAVFASFVCIIAVAEYGGSAPWLIYGVVSALSLMLLPNKLPAVYFALFFGFYPILKAKLDKINSVVAWLLKEIVFNISLFLIIALSIFVFGLQNNDLIGGGLMLWALIALSEIVFVLYDIVLGRLVVFYKVKLRKRLKIK